jgi:hypothetical protein
MATDPLEHPDGRWGERATFHAINSSICAGISRYFLGFAAFHKHHPDLAGAIAECQAIRQFREILFTTHASQQNIDLGFLRRRGGVDSANAATE